MGRPELLCLMFESTHTFPHFSSKHFGSKCNCNMNVITNWKLILMSYSFEACLLKIQSFSALLLPINMFLCQKSPIIVSVCFPCEVSCFSLVKVCWNRFITSLRSMRVLTSTLCKIGLIICEDRLYRQNDQTWSFYFSKEIYQQSRVSSNGDNLVYKSVPSISVLWSKICDKCVATMTCFSKHQGLDFVHANSSSISTPSKQLEKMKAQQKNLKNDFDTTCNWKQMKTHDVLKVSVLFCTICDVACSMALLVHNVAVLQQTENRCVCVANACTYKYKYMS